MSHNAHCARSEEHKKHVLTYPPPRRFLSIFTKRMVILVLIVGAWSLLFIFLGKPVALEEVISRLGEWAGFCASDAFMEAGE